jgi:hypothetical protein
LWRSVQRKAPDGSGPNVSGGISVSKAARGVLGSKAAGGNPGSNATRGNLGSKVAGGNSGSKAVGGTSSSKAVPGAKKAVAPAKKCHVPMVGAMAGIYSKEYHESSPHDQAVWDWVAEIESRLEPHRQSSPASALRLDREALLHISVPLGAGGVSVGW